MAHTSPTACRESLEPNLGAAAAARGALNRFSSHLDNDLRERSALVISEVVTNAVSHAGLAAAQRVDLRIAMSAELLRIEVTDDGPGFDPAAVEPDPAQKLGGWGLVLIDRMTDRWGVDFAHSTHVWCEFDIQLQSLEAPTPGRPVYGERGASLRGGNPTNHEMTN
jgi:anti-sigma regulatory factor (Ser/Thr protein kinase)